MKPETYPILIPETSPLLAREYQLLVDLIARIEEKGFEVPREMRDQARVVCSIMTMVTEMGIEGTLVTLASVFPLKTLETYIDLSPGRDLLSGDAPRNS